MTREVKMSRNLHSTSSCYKLINILSYEKTKMFNISLQLFTKLLFEKLYWFVWCLTRGCCYEQWFVMVFMRSVRCETLINCTHVMMLVINCQQYFVNKETSRFHFLTFSSFQMKSRNDLLQMLYKYDCLWLMKLMSEMILKQ